MEIVGEIGLDFVARHGVKETDETGRPASGDPQHGVLQRGAPSGSKVGSHIATCQMSAGVHVILEVFDGFLHELF